MQRDAYADLEALALADHATAALAGVLASVPVPPSDSGAAASQHNALWMMCIAGLRAARAAMAVIGRGYEDQAIGHARLIDELHNRAQKVREDSSGEYARQWLQGKPPGSGAKLAGQDFWELISGPVHADPRGILDWLAVSQDDGTTSVVVGPERRPDVTNATLTYIASEIRDLACMLLKQVGRPLDGFTDLTKDLEEAFDKHLPGRSTP